MSIVFLSYTQAQLDDCYDQRVWAADAAGAVRRLGVSSAAVREALAHEADIPYGPSADERLDWFAGEAGAPIHLHVHGGAWRVLAKEDASFAAPAFVDKGIHHVVPNFAKLPAVGLRDVVEQLARAVATVYRTAHLHGGDPQRILLSGHSSGAHLAAVLMTLDWAERGLPADVIKAGLCAGGIYDLEPVLLSARGSYVHLSPDEAEALSPIRHVGAIRCPVTVLHGDRESPEFIRQAQAFAAALAAVGRLAGFAAMHETDHFQVNEAFGVPGSPVHDAALLAISAMSGRARADEA